MNEELQYLEERAKKVVITFEHGLWTVKAVTRLDITNCFEIVWSCEYLGAAVDLVYTEWVKREKENPIYAKK